MELPQDRRNAPRLLSFP